MVLSCADAVRLNRMEKIVSSFFMLELVFGGGRRWNRLILDNLEGVFIGDLRRSRC